MLDNILRFLSIILAEVFTRLLPQAAVKDAAAKRQRRQRRRVSCGASARRRLLCQRCTRSAILTQVAAPKMNHLVAPSTCVKTEPLKNIVSRPFTIDGDTECSSISCACPCVGDLKRERADSAFPCRDRPLQDGPSNCSEICVLVTRPSYTKRLPEAVRQPRARLNTFMWLHSYVGQAPNALDQHPPSRETVEKKWARQELRLNVRNLVVAALFI